MVTISWGALIAICAAVVTISEAIKAIIGAVKAVRKPEHRQNEQIQKLDEQVKAIEEKLGNDKSRLDELEAGLEYTLESLLALLSHAIDGNDVDGLKTAKTHLNSYLIGKVKR